jgi:predicted DCC family thiol-disulfide oxidoreductase YuxK
MDVAGIPDGLILFDGVCVLCSRSVRFVLENDTDEWFCFAPMQSPYGLALASRLGIDAQIPGTSAVVVRGRAFFKSDGAIQVLQRLPRYSWTRALSLLPRPLRDLIYDWVAKNRYRLFGRSECCMSPSPEFTGRFLTEEISAAHAGLAQRRPSPFQFLLGGQFDRLPTAVRYVHACTQPLYTIGRAEACATAGILVRLLSWFAGLPRPGKEIPLAVSFHSDGHRRQFWQRQFGDRHYASTLQVADIAPALLVEHFGWFKLYFWLTAEADALAWSLIDWRFGGVPLPRWTKPRIECRESADGERFVFDIDVTFPLLGHVTHYRGWLVPTCTDVTAIGSAACARSPGPGRG